MLLVSLMISFINSLLKKVVQTSRNHENTFNSELLSHFTLDSNPVRNFMCLDWRRTASPSRLAAALMSCAKGKDSVCVNVNLDLDYSAAEAFI